LYCSKCGTNNAEYALYCANDGYDLYASSNEIRIEPTEAGFCSACGETMMRHAAYCSTCGEEAGNQVSEKMGSRGVHGSAWALDYKTLIKRGMLGGVAAITAVLILCMVISITLNKQIPEFLSTETPLFEILDQYEVDSNFTILGVLETVMAVNLIPSSMHISGEPDLLQGQTLDIHLGLISLLLLPLLALVFGGYVSARTWRLSTNRESFLISLVIGIYYGLFLLIVSGLAGFSKKIGMEMYTYVQSAKLVYSFSSVEALVYGWILGAFFSWIGYKLYTLIHTDKRRIWKGNAAYQAVRAVITGLVVLTLLTFVIVAVKFGQQIPVISIILLTPQIGLYLFNSAHLGTIQFGGGNEIFQYSLISGLRTDSGESTYGYSNSFLGMHFIDGYVYSGLFVTLVILVWVGFGYVRSQRQSPNLLPSIGIFSVTYGAMMAFFAKISSIGFMMAGGEEIGNAGIMNTFFVNFSMGYVFLTSCILSLLLLVTLSFVSQKLY
jgi:hypothetical protein